MTKYQTKSLFPVDQPQEVSCSGVVQLAFAEAVDNQYDYMVADKLWPLQIGQRVLVPFGKANKPTEGFIVAVNPRPPDKGRSFKLKKVSEVIDAQPLIDAELMALARWISQYYVCPLGQVLAAMVPAAVKKAAGEKREKMIWLAETDKSFSEKLKGKKQKLVVESLKNAHAIDENSAISADEIFDQAGCTWQVVKKLAENMIVGVTYKTVLKSLPAIPQSLTTESKDVVLNDDQQKVLKDITSQMDCGKFAVTLLHGVTDSGKTEVYIRAIEACLKKGKAAIILLPEIALTAQTVQRFSSRFEKIAVMHSSLTASQRNEQWQKIKAGQADVIIGARSAVFAPVANLGIIVVDEEHEPSFKQDVTPRYNARDVAIKRVQLCDGLCLLGSATPSLESMANCKTKKYFHLASLPKRVMDLPAPSMTLVDLKEGFFTRKGIHLISEPLAQRLKEILSKKEQAILLLNRRGYSSFIFCPACKHTLNCRNCDVSLTFHKSKPRENSIDTISGKHIEHGTAVCHYCSAKTLVPEKCPVCGAKMTMIGFGSQKLEEELANKFPSAKIARIDSDSMAGKDYYRLLKDFSQGKIDILAGTQMLAKGLHFPNVTVVGIISADTALYVPDFRANERTFQLICQVAGRTGRSEKGGQVFVQSFLDNHPAIQFAMQADYDGFVKEELTHRKACNLPPYWRLAAITLQAKNFENLQIAGRSIRQRLDSIVAADGLQTIIRGPLPAGISRIQRFHRIRIIVQTPDAKTMTALFTSLRSAGPVKPAVRMAIDIDPVNLI